MTQAILVAGSLHYDVVVDAPRMPHLDETLMGAAVRYIAGGKGRNQAVAAAMNGAQTYMAGRLGSDAAGDMMRSDLEAHGIDTSLLQIGTGEASGMSVAIVTPGGEYGAVVVSGSNFALDTAALAVPESVGVVLLQNEIADEANLAVARLAKAAGASVVLNAAPAKPLSDTFAGLIDVLVVNRGEAAELSGRPVESVEDAVAAAPLLAARFPKVILTLGGLGAVHMRAGGRAEHQPAFRAEIVSAHGAGDFFVGAFANQLASGSEFEAAIHYAQAAAAIYVSTEVDKRHMIRPVHIRARLGED